MKKLLLLAVSLCGLAAWLHAANATARALPSADGWTTLPSGLELGVYTVDSKPSHGDGRLVVVRIDPARFELDVYTASRDGEPRTAADWVEHGALVAINASMFAPDHRTAVSLLIADGHPNQAELSTDNSVLAFGGGAPRMIDRTCDDLDALRPAYRSLVQGIRMLGCDGSNVWEEQPRKWSEAAIGQDAAGNILFLFARTPWSAHTFIEHARAADLDLVRLQHADGGPPAQLAWRDGDGVVGLVGSYESDVQPHDLTVSAAPIPNLVGVRVKR